MPIRFPQPPPAPLNPNAYDSGYVYVNAKNAAYGAKGDGVTDDYASLVAAETAAKALGATVYLPAGTYMVSQPAPFDVSYDAFHFGATIKLLPGANCAVMQNPGTAVLTALSINEITLDGNRAQNTSGAGLVANMTHCTFNHFTVQNVAGYGIHQTVHAPGDARGGNRWLDLRVQNCKRSGVLFDSLVADDYFDVIDIGFNGSTAGFATGGSTTTMVDSTKSWQTNEWAGYTVSFGTGTGHGESATVVSNTATTLTFAALGTAPDNTTTYNLFFAATDAGLEFGAHGATSNVATIRVHNYEIYNCQNGITFQDPFAGEDCELGVGLINANMRCGILIRPANGAANVSGNLGMGFVRFRDNGMETWNTNTKAGTATYPHIAIGQSWAGDTQTYNTTDVNISACRFRHTGQLTATPSCTYCVDNWAHANDVSLNLFGNDWGNGFATAPVSNQQGVTGYNFPQGTEAQNPNNVGYYIKDSNGVIYQVMNLGGDNRLYMSGNVGFVAQVPAGATNLWVDASLGVQAYQHRLQAALGAPVASANNLTLGTDGNTFHITGAVQINLIDSTNWNTGAEIVLIFDSTPVVKYNQTASGAFKPIIPRTKADVTAVAQTTMKLVYDGTNWIETS